MSENSDSSLRVLIAETDRIVARDIELTLQKSNFTVVGAPAAVYEVISLVEETKPNLAILSVKFDTEDGGIELAKLLRRNYSLPVVFLTGRSEDSVYEMAREARPVGYVRKPFSGAELIATIEAAAQRLEPTRNLESRIPEIRSMMAPLEEGIIVWGIDGRIVHLNESAEALTGWKEVDASGRLYSEVVPTVYPASNGRSNGANREGHGAPCLITDKMGNQHSVETITTPVLDDDSELLGTITVLKGNVGKNGHSNEAEDETDYPSNRAKTLEILSSLANSDAYQNVRGVKKSEEDSEAEGDSVLIDELGDPFVVLDRDMKVKLANTEALLAFSDNGGTVLGRPFWDLFTEGEISRYEEHFLRPLIDGKRHRFEFQDSGRANWFEVRLYRTHDGVIALFHDISDSRISKAEEVRQHRLEGLGLLARGFAHDFNNHLTTVKGNIGLAKEYEENPDVIEMLDEAEVASSRAAGLVQQLMTFATGGRPVREPVKIPDLLRQVLSEHRVARPAIRFQFQCSENEIRANVDRAQVRRVVENLINNAEESMPGGGSLTLSCRVMPLAEVDTFGKEIPPTEEDFLVVEVIDTGVGMDSETLEKAFDPYFSNRSNDNATGIGLTVCESIAKAHEGFVHLESEPGEGSKASFCVPLGLNVSHVEWEDVPSTESEAETGPDFDSVKISGDFNKGARILILEDEGPIRRLIATTLRRGGFEVVETAEGGETISEYRKSQEENRPFDLVITDLTIENGMGGLETMRKLREMDPEVVAIVSSGYSDAAAMANPSAFGFKGVVPKPYSPSVLKEAVDKTLARYAAKVS